MPIELKMPALSPTMEEGTLAKWLVKEGDEVKSGDILAEIETDKATMEFEAVDEGKIAKILVPEGSEGVKVGAPIAILAGEGEDASKAAAAAPKADTAAPAPPKAPAAPRPDETPKAPPARGARSKLRRRRALRLRRSAPRATASRPRRSPAASRRRRTSICPRSRAAVPAAGSSAPTSTTRPGRRPPLLQLRLPRASAGARTRHPPRHAGTDRAGDPARGGQAVEHPQDHRPAPDRGQAAGPAHLSHRRYPARRASEAPHRAQRRSREPQRQAQRQRPLDQGARPVADRGAGVQRRLRRRPDAEIQPRRHLGRGIDPGGPDHADHRRRREPRACRRSRPR